MRSRRNPIAIAAAVLLLVGAPAARAQSEVLGQDVTPASAEAPGEAYHLSFEIQTKLRSTLYDADLGSAGELHMRRREGAGPGLALSLVEPIQAPFTLFWLKVALKDHMVRYYDVLTLPAGTEAARAAAKADSDAHAQRVYRAFQEQGGKGKLERAYSLYVVGPPADRFEPRFGPSGDLLGMENRLTHRWLPGKLDRWYEKWNQEQGYSGREGAEPPDWEPHTYHSFVRIMSLFEYPEGGAEALGGAGSLGEDETVELVHPEVAGKVLDAIQTLVPKADLSFSGRSPALVKYQVAGKNGSRLELEGRSGVLRVVSGEGLRFLLSRRLSLDLEEKRPVRDEIVFRAWKSGQEVTARVAYAPATEPWPAREDAGEP